tara:strand:- start:18871 stop:19380 length:510 start_codon:yes stop_codon:yes gene_type:complete
MSALTHSGSGTPFSKQAIPVRRDEQLPHNINLIPRSATGGNDLDLTLDHCDASSVLETQGYHDEDIDIASDTQSSSPLAGTRDGKPPELGDQLCHLVVADNLTHLKNIMMITLVYPPSVSTTTLCLAPALFEAHPVRANLSPPSGCPQTADRSLQRLNAQRSEDTREAR